MNEYILTNRVPIEYSPEDAKSVNTLWNALTDQWKAEDIFVTSFVFPSKGFIILDGGTTTVQQNVFSAGLKIVSTTILRAGNYKEVIQRTKQCPILQQGGAVEVIEIMVRPLKP